MQISSILSRQRDAQAFGKRAEAEAAAGRAAVESTARTGSSAGNPALGQIVAQYDVSNITPQKFSEMVQKLRDAGVVNESEVRELNQVRTDLDSNGVRPDQTVNLRDFYQEQLRSLQAKAAAADATQPAQRAALEQSLAGVQRRMEWVEKFAAMHEAPDAVGLNTLA